MEHSLTQNHHDETSPINCNNGCSNTVVTLLSHLWCFKASWTVFSNDWEVAGVSKCPQVLLTDIDKRSNHSQITFPERDDTIVVTCVQALNLQTYTPHTYHTPFPPPLSPFYLFFVGGSTKHKTIPQTGAKVIDLLTILLPLYHKKALTHLTV